MAISTCSRSVSGDSRRRRHRRRRLPRRQGPQPDRAGSRAAPLLGPDTVVVSTQNGIPWWYFQGHGGELDGLRLERVDPGGVIASAIEPRRVVGSLAYFATDIVEPGVIHHTEGNRISFGEPNGTRVGSGSQPSPRP